MAGSEPQAGFDKVFQRHSRPQLPNLPRTSQESSHIRPPSLVNPNPQPSWVSSLSSAKSSLEKRLGSPRNLPAAKAVVGDFLKLGTLVEGTGELLVYNKREDPASLFMFKLVPSYQKRLLSFNHAHVLTPRFVMSTEAGVRVLSLDGGGIKGNIPLVFLQTLEEKVGVYGAPIYNYFDYVCGTSAGGLIVLGIFLMRWTIPECIQKFLRLAENTFRASSVTESTLGRLQHLVLSYLRDCRYSSSAIERAFQSATGTDVEMFNPLSDDTKVAVTATTVKQPQPCIFSNYNGPPRSPGHGYDAIRHSFERRLSVSKAAASTSAAPWYFKPVNLKGVGTFQDGGLQHNNPLNMALWEVKFLWPDRPRPDLALSIGTGTNDSIPVRGPQSPARKRFLSRIFDTFMENMDGERLWREFRNSLPEKERDKYYRWNLPLDDPQPPLDDIRAMHHLRKRAEDHMACNIKIQPVLDALLASSFYFELDAIPKWKEDAYLCKGHIFCRVSMTKQGRQQLILDLAAKSSYFLILGRPVKCVGRVGKYAPPFSREISFTVPSLDDQIGITLRGVTSEPKTISGLPRTVREIMFSQRLEVPFGRSDHKRPEKRLPKLPRKRKMDDTDWF